MVSFCAVRTTVRIAWLVAASLLLARAVESIIDAVRHVLGWYIFSLPGRPYPFTPWLNAAALLATSFAIVATCAWLIEERLIPRMQASSHAANVKPKPESTKTAHPWWNALRDQWMKETRKSPSTKYWMIGFIVLCAIYGVLKGCAGTP